MDHASSAVRGRRPFRPYVERFGISGWGINFHGVGLNPRKKRGTLSKSNTSTILLNRLDNETTKQADCGSGRQNDSHKTTKADSAYDQMVEQIEPECIVGASG